MTILVTGACGRIAGQIISRLVARGSNVLATDKLQAPDDRDQRWGGASSKLVEFVQADLTDCSAVRAMVQRSSAVVHVGAVPGPSKVPPPGVDKEWAAASSIGLEDLSGVELLRQNLIGTCNVLEAAAEGGECRRVVFSSSLFAMGWSHDPFAFRPEYLPLDEHHSPLPLEHYGLSKVVCEEFASMLVRAGVSSCEPKTKRRRLDPTTPTIVSLRFSNIVKEEKWLDLPWKAASKPLTPLLWAYTHELDVVDAHLKALDVSAEKLPSRCESFLIAASDTRMDIPTEELLKQQWPAEEAPSRKAPMPGFTSIVCSDKARHILGFAPRSFRETQPKALPAPVAGQSTVTATDGSGRSWSLFRVPEDFALHSGSKLAGGFLAYKTYGKLNADASNVILHPTSFDACHWELEFNVGDGNMLDTGRYFVIIVNLLGNGVSFSPSSFGGDAYPAAGVTVCDNVRLQALLLDSLGISRIALIYGYSMGAIQALHWGAMFPSRVGRIAAVCGSARASDYNKVFLESLQAALHADPALRRVDGQLTLVGNASAGLRAFAKIYAGWGVSLDFYRNEVWKQSSRDGKPFSSREDFVERSYVGGFAGGHPLNLLAQVDTWKSADIAKAHGMPPGITLKEALQRIQAKVYYMPCTTDRYFTVEETREEAAAIPACRFAPIESVWGHRAGDPHRPGQEDDKVYIRKMVSELLAAAA